MWIHRWCANLALLLLSLPAFCQREPALKQIDLPHPYYYREMYIPQLTTGPSAAAWELGSRTLVYSMAGTLWRQKIDSSEAEQLTSGLGYDYQPDCSPDGRWVVYSSYQKDAIELWALDLHTKRTRQLTTGGTVNVEPRFSPDGKRLVFVSTSYRGHFHIFIGKFENGELTNVERVTGETRTPLPRFYYSEFDHEINPAWSPDGKELIFVSNHGHVYGTGGFWRMKAETGAEPREIHYEETSWKARPEFSPDGKRIVYASYLGQQWHQLWLMPSEGGNAFPISYGDFDNTSPRWSPDGTKIAFISNRGGNTSLWIQTIPGGTQTEVVPKHKHYLKPMGELEISILDPKGKPTLARVFITGDGRAYAPDDAWMHGEDDFVRTERSFESHYFHTKDIARVAAPAGRVEVEVMKGFEYRIEKQIVQVGEGETAKSTVRLKRLDVPADPGYQWASGDLHVHMNYGGTYRNTPKNLEMQEEAENLSLIENLIVNKEQRVPDIGYFRAGLDPASKPDHLLLHSQEFHTNAWGHLGLLNLMDLLIPGYAAYGNTAAASPYPMNADVADMAHAQGGLVGYVHPLDMAIDPMNDPTLVHGQQTDEALELPVDAALGKIDYIEAMGFSDHRLTADVWYRLLNCGFRLPAGAGSDAMANYASLHGPVGLVRVYARVRQGALNVTDWLNSLKNGHTFATNGPLIGFSLGGKQPGEELALLSGQHEVEVRAWMRSIAPVEHLQVVCNGKIVRELKLSADRENADEDVEIPISQSGWCLLRAWSEKAEHPILDDYVYATTSPIYVSVAGSIQKSPEDVAYFIAWVDRLIALASANQNWNADAEKASVLKTLNNAKAVYDKLAR
jgi:Tol biopolymer transport system component